MNFFKSIIVFTAVATQFVACKDAASQPSNSDNLNKSQNKEIVAATKPETATIQVEGMTCAIGCAKTIEKNLSDLKGVQKATVNFDTKTATINFDLDVLSANDLVNTIEKSADGKTYKVGEIKTGNKV